jgi:hypothetical protein
VDLNNHFQSGFLMTYLPLSQIDNTLAIISAITLGLYGTLPDAVPDTEYFIRNRKFGGWTEWGAKFYNKAHSYGYWWLNIVPTSLFHIFMDSFCHGEGKRWYAVDNNWHYFLPTKWFRERIWMESISWVIWLTLTWFFVSPYMAVGLLILLTTIIFISERESK